MNRLHDLGRFYALLHRLEQRVGGTRLLANLSSYKDWPDRGVYLFFEPSEERDDSGEGARVVRVGTHALTGGSRSTLRQRLSQHRGKVSGGGNHRGSIFRLLVGQSLQARGDLMHCMSWGVKGDVGKASEVLETNREAINIAEAPVEQAVTDYIGTMPFLWLNIDDSPAPNSLRGLIERNSIALLSNHERTPLDPSSPRWLGQVSNRALVRGSGLWNQRHVEDSHDPAFLDTLETIVMQTGRDA